MAELKVLSANNEEHEAERVAGEPDRATLFINRLMAITRSSIAAIISREFLKRMLMQNRILYKISGGTSFFSRPEIKDLLPIRPVSADQPDDDSAFTQHRIRQSVKSVGDAEEAG
jgi:ATP-dependent DNA helicase Rep